MPEPYREILEYTFWGISLSQAAAAFLAILLGFASKRILLFLFERLKKATERTKFAYDDVLIESLGPPLGWGAVLFGLFLAIQILPIPREPIDIYQFVMTFFKGASVLLLAWFGMRLTDGLCDKWSEVAQTTDAKIGIQAIPVVRRSLRVFIVLIGAALFLQNLGYSVGSLLAGLGLGGAALALAAKDSLANLFGAIVIFLDRPFQVGDWIEVGPVEGTVEEVGLRTTRIRTFANSLITLPNSALTTTHINNWSRMKKRRIKLNIGVTYDTGAEQMEQAVENIRRILREDPNIAQDFFLVNFDAFGASALEIFVYCFTTTTIWAEFLEAKQALLLKIMRELQGMGLSFAFPTQTVHVEGLSLDPVVERPERPR